MRIIDLRIDNKYVTLVSSLVYIYKYIFCIKFFYMQWDTSTNEK